MWNANWTELFLELKNEGWNVISTFVKSVDWTEKWIWCLFGVLAIWCFIIDSCIVFGGRTLNRLGGCFCTGIVTSSRYWQSFASKNYFDEDGMFFSFMVSFPLLILTAIQTVALRLVVDV